MKKRSEALKKRIARYLKKEQLFKDEEHKKLGKPSLKAYKHINLKENLRTPSFLRYEDLLMKFRGYGNL